MTRKTNARLAGFMFLFYIATAFPEMVLFSRAATGDGIPARLASIAQHATSIRVAIILSMITFLDAILLGIALYGLTRDEDQELAVLALGCRVGEGVLNALPVSTLGLLWLSTASSGAASLDAASVNTLASFLVKVGGWKTLSASMCFAVGSTIFAYLLLRSRSIPTWLAWTGVIGSAILVVGLPIQLAGFLASPVTDLMWIPIAVFEIVLGFWLLIKGIGPARVR
jgi:hypothetical protein